MKHRLSRIVAITALYILIIFGIFVIQFTVGKTFSYNIGAMTVSGRHDVDKAGNTAPLLPLHIVSNGLEFYITEKNPIIAHEQSGKDIYLTISAYKKQDNSFTIECSENISVTFFSDSKSDISSVKISVSMPDNIKTVYFPWKLTQSARLERVDNQIFLRYGKKRYVFKGGYGFENSDESMADEFPHLILASVKPFAQYETYIESQSLAFESIPNQQLASDTAYEETKALFKKNAETALKNSISARTYNEQTLTAYISELASKNLYNKALKEAPAGLLPKEKRTYLSTPFYNNLVQNSKLLALKNSEDLKEINTDIGQKNANVFKFKSIIPFLVNTAKENLVHPLEAIANSVSDENLDMQTVAGILEASMDFSLYFPKRKNTFKMLEEKCENILKSSLLSVNNGLYISPDMQKIETEQTLYIASVLIRYGKENPEKNIWKFVGQMLYSSIFLLTGNSSGLPAFFYIQGEAPKLGLKADDTLILHAEDLYPMAVTDNNYYPHAESLAFQAEHGMWAWTSAKKITVTQNTAKNFSFKVDFKTGDIHHIILHGVRPFYRIQIHGIDFRTDQRFELYNSSGYVYDRTSKTLLLKLKHKKDSEDITLFFGEPPTPVPAAVPADPNTEKESPSAETGEQPQTSNETDKTQEGETP